MQKIFRRFCMGVGFAATTYLIVLTIQFQKTMPTIRNTASILIMGGIIGLLSFIFKTDLSYLSALIVHFILTFVVVLIMIWINKWHLNFTSILMFGTVYVIIWAIIRINQINDVNKINRKLKERK